VGVDRLNAAAALALSETWKQLRGLEGFWTKVRLYRLYATSFEPRRRVPRRQEANVGRPQEKPCTAGSQLGYRPPLLSLLTQSSAETEGGRPRFGRG
jgi:hypothetical protein